MTDKTLVTFLLDRTGSMEQVRDDTIGAFNAYLDSLKAGGADIVFSFLQFDSVSIDKICVGIPVADAKPLTRDTYQPRAWTPLIDAAFKTIKAVEEKAKNGEKVVVCIQTDGEENASVEHTWEELNALIKEKIGLGWQFNFMGAGIDAYKQGARMGIAAAATVSYDSADPIKTRAAYAAVADCAVGFASGRLGSVNLSMAAKQASGDKFASGLSQPKPAKPKTKTVDDFRL